MTSDRILRDHEATESFDFGTTPATVAPPLSQARVAIVTTAGFHHADGGTWVEGQGFVAFDAADRALTLAHAATNFDRTCLLADLSVVYRADRLEEMAA